MWSREETELKSVVESVKNELESVVESVEDEIEEEGEEVSTVCVFFGLFISSNSRILSNFTPGNQPFVSIMIKRGGVKLERPWQWEYLNYVPNIHCLLNYFFYELFELLLKRI